MPETSVLDGEGFAVGRVEGEVGAVEVDAGSSADAAGCPRGSGQGIRDGGDLGRFGIDVKGGADDDVAEVKGPGDRGGDDRQAERGALVGAGEVDVAGNVDGVRPAPAPVCAVPIWEAVGQLGFDSSSRPE